MKHYIDIDNIREENTDLGNGMTRKSNCSGFTPGEHLNITVKIDGTNGSFMYDSDNNTLKAFSRKNELNAMNTNQGFWNYVQTLNAEEYKNDSRYIPFGEWLIHNKVNYEPEAYRHFYVFDVWDKEESKWMNQEFVKEYCTKHNLERVPELYDGPFISWEHCKSFMDCHWRSLSQEEGVVCKLVDKIGDGESRLPAYLKLVNESFKETMKTRIKTVDPEKESAKKNAEELMSSIVTKNRVEKELLKMRNEGVIPAELTAKDMGSIAKILPTRIMDDCLKEENEICMAAGEYGAKACTSITMKFAREIILGNE